MIDQKTSGALTELLFQAGALQLRADIQDLIGRGCVFTPIEGKGLSVAGHILRITADSIHKTIKIFADVEARAIKDVDGVQLGWFEWSEKDGWRFFPKPTMSLFVNAPVPGNFEISN